LELTLESSCAVSFTGMSKSCELGQSMHVVAKLTEDKHCSLHEIRGVPVTLKLHSLVSSVDLL